MSCVHALGRVPALNVSIRRFLLENPIYRLLRALLVHTCGNLFNLNMFLFMRARLTSVFFGAFIFSTPVQFSLF
jgi:hypothetical protein